MQSGFKHPVQLVSISIYPFPVSQMFPTMAERVHLFTTPNLLHATPNPFHATSNSLHATPNLFHATLNTIENGQRYAGSGQQYTN